MQKAGDWTTEAPFERMDSVWNIGASAPRLKTGPSPPRPRRETRPRGDSRAPDASDFPPISAALDDRGDLA